MIPELFFVPESRVQSGCSHQATERQDARTSCLPRSRFSFGGGGGGGRVACHPQNGCEGDYRKSRQDKMTSRQEDIENRRRVIFDPDTAPLALAVNKSPAALDDL